MEKRLKHQSEIIYRLSSNLRPSPSSSFLRSKDERSKRSTVIDSQGQRCLKRRLVRALTSGDASWFDDVVRCIVHTGRFFLNVADAATPLDRRASSVKWQPRGILDATKEGVAMIVGQKGWVRPVRGGSAVKGRGCDDGLSHAVSRLDDCDKTAAIMGLHILLVLF